ncbi:vWA domain-containing protein [Siminovitchia sp. 179-K 8D1 HS]|uniref:vWA domain-containing protein n=1 Tax=Siminovitchia sp. 179-K 8D1 HS TaxID=3142385 RepID=UPI00399FB792
MLYRFIDFNDKKIDSFLLLELEDLAKTLAKTNHYKVDFRKLSYLSFKEKKIYVSHFWDDRAETIKMEGMKSEIFLRAFGNIHFTDFPEIEHFTNFASGTKIPSFARQLLMLAEDIRIEEECKRKREGMNREFRTRRAVYMDYFESQLAVNLEKNLLPDAFFNFVYLFWNTNKPIVGVPSFRAEMDMKMPLFLEKLEKAFEAKSTKDCAALCSEIVEMAEPLFPGDMINEYFHLPVLSGNRLTAARTDQAKKISLENSDPANKNKNGDINTFREEMKTWHRETEKEGKNHFHFDLERGTPSNGQKGHARKGDPNQTEITIIRGKSGKSAFNTEADTGLEGVEGIEQVQETYRYGEANKHAKALFIPAKKPDANAALQYSQLREGVLFYKRKLKNIIEQTLERKKSGPRTNREMGRLGKNLIPFFTEAYPKLFYKKAEPAKEIDAVFSLLVDCSASMADKMTETKRGIILFHEALKSVHVPHEVTGFWEDANEATKNEQPNYFDKVISFSHSLNQKAGPEIMRLEEREDNRDGFSIRITSESLLQRPEKQKFLLIFSDGEPSAYGYHQNGIIDTHEAVTEARKKGIKVLNILLSTNGMDPGQEEVFKNIYGNKSIMAEKADQLPDILFPLLKKLLHQSINE